MNRKEAERLFGKEEVKKLYAKITKAYMYKNVQHLPQDRFELHRFKRSLKTGKLIGLSNMRRWFMTETFDGMGHIKFEVGNAVYWVHRCKESLELFADRVGYKDLHKVT